MVCVQAIDNECTAGIMWCVQAIDNECTAGIMGYVLANDNECTRTAGIMYSIMRCVY